MTATLSRDLSRLIHTGMNTFDQIAALKAPEMRAFTNAVIESEFRALSAKLEKRRGARK